MIVSGWKSPKEDTGKLAGTLYLYEKDGAYRIFNMSYLELDLLKKGHPYLSTPEISNIRAKVLKSSQE
jgi:hypothetical protein